MPARPDRIRIGVFDLRHPERAQNLETRHIGKVQVEKDDVVIVKLAEVDALLTEIGGVDVEALGLEHQFDRLRCGAVVLNQQNAHASPLFRRCGAKDGTPERRPFKRLATIRFGNVTPGMVNKC